MIVEENESRFVPKLDVKKHFGTSVRNWRNQLGLSQEQLAERADLHRTYISDVERGARNVSLESIEKLARALEVSVSTLLLRAGKSSAGNAPAKTPPPDELVEILFVEDNAEDAELAMNALERANITNRIFLVRDGQAALDFLFCTGAYADRRFLARPRLILLDLNLPKINGLEVLRRIKASPDISAIPVVVLTASARDRDFIESKRLGAESYIVKPVDFNNFSAVMPQLDLRWALLKPTSAVSA